MMGSWLENHQVEEPRRSDSRYIYVYTLAGPTTILTIIPPSLTRTSIYRHLTKSNFPVFDLLVLFAITKRIETHQNQACVVSF